MFIWCINVKEVGGAQQYLINSLLESTNSTGSDDLWDLCQMLRQTIQKPLCHTPTAFAILTTTYEAPPEAHSERRAHEALYKGAL